MARRRRRWAMAMKRKTLAGRCRETVIRGLRGAKEIVLLLYEREAFLARQLPQQGMPSTWFRCSGDLWTAAARASCDNCLWHLACLQGAGKR